MKRRIKYFFYLLARTLGARWILQQLNLLLRSLCSFTHHAQYFIEWKAPPNPEWFDHFIGQYYLWKKTGVPLSWERGIFSLLAIKDQAKVLELCCGDGFNAHHFYAIRAAEITSIDFDPKAIKAAKRNFKGNGVKYLLGDIRKDIPKGLFDNVIWDAAIEHFTEEEIVLVLSTLKERLGTSGILSGYTIVESDEGKSHHDHEYEFKSKKDLVKFLNQHFRRVRVFETIYPDRHNLYFFASNNGTLPFDDNWDKQIII
jgi:SAM-dependent methyltransferase